ncbi:MAG: response regulator [Gammaproteobacteria bacterium]|nr:response regulator [Gammaproteobacteria bacterium]
MSEEDRTKDTLAPFSGCEILVVEDNAINFMVLEQQLIKLGCRVSWADTGEKGVELYAEKPFNCVFMDCMLPGMSGLECTTHIRKYEKDNNLKRTPVIALTADVRESNKQACFDVDMDDFMGKPFKFSELSNILNLWINQQTSSKNSV